MGELARRARLSKQTMTTLISAMEKKGLIQRSRDPQDARAFRVYLTRRSWRFMSIAKEVLGDMDRTVQDQVPKPQVEKLRDALKTLMNMSVGSSSLGVDRLPEE
jgi:DNA-binding MarR family transcriptional regulator